LSKGEVVEFFLLFYRTNFLYNQYMRESRSYILFSKRQNPLTGANIADTGAADCNTHDPVQRNESRPAHREQRISVLAVIAESDGAVESRNGLGGDNSVSDSDGKDQHQRDQRNTHHAARVDALFGHFLGTRHGASRQAEDKAAQENHRQRPLPIIMRAIRLKVDHPRVGETYKRNHVGAECEGDDHTPAAHGTAHEAGWGKVFREGAHCCFPRVLMEEGLYSWGQLTVGFQDFSWRRYANNIHCTLSASCLTPRLQPTPQPAISSTNPRARKRPSPNGTRRSSCASGRPSRRRVVGLLRARRQLTDHPRAHITSYPLQGMQTSE